MKKNYRVLVSGIDDTQNKVSYRSSWYRPISSVDALPSILFAVVELINEWQGVYYIIIQY